MNVVLLGTKFSQFCQFWPKRCFFHKFLWFWQFFMNFSYFSSFTVILRASVTNLLLPLCFSSNSCVHAQNYGEWWKVGEIREKTVKIKEIREKKNLFRQNRQNLSPKQSNKLLIVITHIFCYILYVTLNID